MTPYFGYIRVSTARQGEGVSLDQQRTAIETYAKTHALSIVDWFEEMESASKRGRPIFNQMLLQLEKRRVRGVIIHKIDRSARHLADWVWVGELIDRGVDVRFVHENLDLTSRSGRLTGDMLAVIAADYSRNLRDEVKKGLYGRLKQGIYPFRAPLGYVDCGGGKPKTIDPIKGPLVRLAFELYASRRFSLLTLRIELHRRGLRQRSGKPLSPESLSTMLNNPFYVGLIRIERTGQMFDGRHVPIVTKALFDQVQAILRNRTNSKVLVHDFALRRILRCASCGFTLTGERQRGHVYYRCHKLTCPGVSIREEDALIELRWYHELIRFTVEDLRDMRDLVEQAKGREATSRAVEEARLKRAVALCDERLSRLTDALLDAFIDKETFETRKGGLLGERRGLLDQIENPPAGTQSERLLEKFERGNAAYLGIISAESDEIREALRNTTSNILVEGKYLAITPKFPFSEVVKTRLSRLGGAYRDVLRTNGSIIRAGHLAIPIITGTDGPRIFAEISELPSAGQPEGPDVLPAAA
jgi:DNA invertase Pin-like site-specific DNA recombinase